MLTPQLAIYKYAVAFSIGSLTSCCSETIYVLTSKGGLCDITLSTQASHVW